MTEAEARVWLRLARDVVSFAVGIGGIIYLLVTSGTKEPTFLIIFAAMVGAPLTLRADSRNEPKKHTDDSVKEPS